MLIDSEAEFVRRLLVAFPELDDLYETHVFNNDGLLAHVFFWDVTQEVVQGFLGKESDVPSWRRFLSFLEEAYPGADTPVKNLIGTSFLYNLPWPGQEGAEIADALGPVLSEVYTRVRA
ncbi:DUF7674 family protein [Spirillospora sp. CA-294931]|uniref:DUF7674 family protein n=1 Tax=Spirillospora sp. CA-294931 TaxID=3240042 RepID=UPI003D93832D